MHSASVREAFLLKPRLKNEKTRMERRQGKREIKREIEGRQERARGAMGKITQGSFESFGGKVGGSAPLPLNDFRRTYSFEFHFGTLNLIKK